MPSTQQSDLEPIYKMSIFARRNPSLTEQEFFDHLGSSHAKLAAGLFKRFGILKYTQNFFTSEHKAQLKKLELPLLDYDAQCELYFKGDLSWFTKMESDEERLNALLPDEQRTFDQGKDGMPGFWFNLAIEYVRLEDGKIMV